MVINHFTATGIVFNLKKQILMIFHNKLKVWLPPGGHIEENELPDMAVIREIFEETGIKAVVIPNKNDFLLTDKHCRELALPFVILLEDIEGNATHNHIDMVYICTAINDELVLQKSEANDIGWFSIEEIGKLNTFENVKKEIYKANEFIQKIGVLEDK